jgi:hypothetical protein
MVKRAHLIPVLATVGACLLAGGTLLPLWSKNGIAVTGWEGNYLAVGRWVLLLVAALAVGAWTLKPLRAPRWMVVAGLLGLLQAGLVLWQGHRLQAIGTGAWVLLAGALLVLLAAVGGWTRPKA